MPAGNAYPSGHLVSSFGNVLLFQLLRPVFPNLLRLFSTFHHQTFSILLLWNINDSSRSMKDAFAPPFSSIQAVPDSVDLFGNVRGNSGYIVKFLLQYVIFYFLLCCAHIQLSTNYTLIYKTSSVLLCTNSRQTCQHLGVVSYRKPINIRCSQNLIVRHFHLQLVHFAMLCTITRQIIQYRATTIFWRLEYKYLCENFCCKYFLFFISFIFMQIKSSLLPFKKIIYFRPPDFAMENSLSYVIFLLVLRNKCTSANNFYVSS